MAGTLADQAALLQAEFASRPDGLRKHVERVAAEAVELARYYDIDPDRVTLAAWGHDLYRAHGPDDLLRLALECGLQLLPEDERNPVMLHGPLAAVVMRERFAIRDEDVLAGVRDHTAGLAAMPLIAKVLLIADKVEPNKRRRTPVMGEIRKLARRDLDLALLCWADWKWVEERQRDWESYPRHWEAREAWVAAHHDEVGLPARVTDAWADSEGEPAEAD